MSSDYFEIQENRDNGYLTLRLIGELDLVSAPRLRLRLRQLSAEGQQIHLDLAKLEFIDSSGIHVLVEAVQGARRTGQRLEFGPELAPQVRHVLRLVHLEQLIEAPLEAAAEPHAS